MPANSTGAAASTAAATPSPADQPNAFERVDITAADLPLHCPMPGKRLWDSHPRVYLPIKPGGEEICPYCGTRYVFAAPPVAD
ncbi:MAG: zinc-finger domain-containing protein [Gammaproteobacteria bacterium]|nr:zinc-finger domain-containing protein [Gammaproteobacteria bacterium]